MDVLSSTKASSDHWLPAGALGITGDHAGNGSTGSPRKSVEGRKAEEKRLDDKRRTEETRPEDKRVTKIDDLARKIDITKRQNPEFLSADKLTDLLKREENSRKVQQAEHAWAGHEQEFKKIGSWIV